MRYATVENIEDYLLIEIDGSFAEKVEAWIEGVSRMMDTMANRKLVADELGSGDDPEERYYDGNGCGYLSIEDCVDVQNVEVDDVAIDYELYPKLPPHRKLIGSFPSGIQNVHVEGNFGYFSVLPADIQLACTVITAGIVNESRGVKGKTSERIGNYQVSYDQDKGIADFERAKAIIESYRLIEF